MMNCNSSFGVVNGSAGSLRHSSNSSVLLGYTFNVLFFLLGTFANGLVLVCFWKSSNLRNKVPYFLIMVLSFVDLVTVITVHPLLLFNWAKKLSTSEEKAHRQQFFIPVGLIGRLSYITMFIINIERYLAVMYPYFYERKVTKQKLLKTVLFFYVFFGATLIPVWLLTDINMEITTCSIAVLLISTAFIYTKIFLTARRPLPPGATVQDSKTAKRLVKVMFNFKLAKTYLLTVASVVIFYLPLGIINIIITTKPCSVQTDILKTAREWCINIVFINSTMNSFIFFWRNRQLREEGKRILKMVFCTWEN